MNRRHFVTALTAATAGFTLDPERLLWVPGKKTYFDSVRWPMQVSYRLGMYSVTLRDAQEMVIATETFVPTHVIAMPVVLGHDRFTCVEKARVARPDGGVTEYVWHFVASPE